MGFAVLSLEGVCNLYFFQSKRRFGLRECVMLRFSMVMHNSGSFIEGFDGI
jgi:hypothetical protein